MISRQTAKKVVAKDIVSGEWVKNEGMNPSFAVTGMGERVARARILGTIVGKFVSDDGNFGSVTIDDGTDTIRAKMFKELEPIEDAKIGEMIDMIGKVREYNGEIYVIPESMKSVKDPNMMTLRKIELLKKRKDMERTKKMVSENQGKNPEDLRKELSEKQGIPSDIIDIYLKGPGGKGEPEGQPEGEKKDMKARVISVLKEENEGIVYSELIKRLDVKESEIESSINELLSEGICYEPSPGKIRMI